MYLIHFYTYLLYVTAFHALRMYIKSIPTTRSNNVQKILLNKNNRAKAHVTKYVLATNKF